MVGTELNKDFDWHIVASTVSALYSSPCTLPDWELLVNTDNYDELEGTTQPEQDLTQDLDSLSTNWLQLVSEFTFGPDTGHVHLEPGTGSRC